MIRFTRYLSILKGVAATGLSLYAISAQAQVCDTHPAFPDATVTSVIDRDHMMCTMGLQFPVLPPRLDDPNKPPNAQPLNAANPEGNWTDSRRHTVVRTSFGGWHTYDSDQGLAGGAMTGVGDYGPHSTPRYTDIDLMQIRKPSWLNPEVTARDDARGLVAAAAAADRGLGAIHAVRPAHPEVPGELGS